MAVVHVKFFRVPVVKGNATANFMSVDGTSVDENITSSAGSQVTTNDSTGKNYVRLVTTGGNVWVKFGTNPTAATSTGHLLVANVPEYFYLPDGYKIAVIN